MVKNQKHEPDAGDFSIVTACEHHIVLNFGVERRKPDCVDCRVPFAGYEVKEEKRWKKQRRLRRVTPV